MTFVFRLPKIAKVSQLYLYRCNPIILKDQGGGGYPRLDRSNISGKDRIKIEY
jgi:hypothetical protein